MLKLITTGNIYGEDVAKDAERRGLKLTSQEFEDIQDFLFDYDPLYVATVGAIAAALDEVVLKRMAKSSGLYVKASKVRRKRDNKEEELRPF